MATSQNDEPEPNCIVRSLRSSCLSLGPVIVAVIWNRMFAAPPILNLVVIRSTDIDRAVDFYEEMGMVFTKHAHGNGPQHYSSVICGFVFEIYPQQTPEPTTSVRIGFNVDDVDGIVEILRELDAKILTNPTDTKWGRRAVVEDFDGHVVELVTPPDRESTINRNYRDVKRWNAANDSK